jgi:glycosyltransferase involved in cell wall biosynthesis
LPDKKKIVLVGPAYPYRGGNSLYVSFLYDLLRNYYDVEVVNYKLLYPSFLFPGTTQNDVSGHVLKEVKSTRLINSVNPFSWFKTAKFIKNLDADLVIFDWWNPFFGPSHRVISQLIRKKYKNRIVFITENVISHEARFVDRFLTKTGLKNACSFVALSKVVEDTLKDYTDKKIYRSALPVYDCYNLDTGIDAEEQRKDLGYGKNDLVILFFGYVRKYKGLNVLIDAMPQILKNNGNAKLLIVGEFYDSPDRYTEQIKLLNLDNHVKIVQRFVPNEEVGKYYSASDIVVLPYLSATQSGVLNIAYGFLKPVIVTDVGGLAEDVAEGKTGYIVAPDSPVAIAEAVEKFNNEKVETDFRKNIEEKLKENLFGKFPSLIEEILNTNK